MLRLLFISKSGMWMHYLRLLTLVSVFFTSSIILASSTKVESIFKFCGTCHGENGEGKKSLAAPAIAGLPMWYVKAQLMKFRSGGRGLHANDEGGLRMRPMARTLQNDVDVDAIAKYVSEREVVNPPRTLKGSPVAGESSYMVCAACHGAKARGMQVLNAPPLANQSDWYLLTQLKHFKSGIRGSNPQLDPIGASMAPMASTLVDEKATLNVIAYIKAFGKVNVVAKREPTWGQWLGLW